MEVWITSLSSSWTAFVLINWTDSFNRGQICIRNCFDSGKLWSESKILMLKFGMQCHFQEKANGMQSIEYHLDKPIPVSCGNVEERERDPTEFSTHWTWPTDHSIGHKEFNPKSDLVHSDSIFPLFQSIRNNWADARFSDLDFYILFLATIKWGAENEGGCYWCSLQGWDFSIWRIFNAVDRFWTESISTFTFVSPSARIYLQWKECFFAFSTQCWPWGDSGIRKRLANVCGFVRLQTILKSFPLHHGNKKSHPLCKRAKSFTSRSIVQWPKQSTSCVYLRFSFTPPSIETEWNGIQHSRGRITSVQAIWLNTTMPSVVRSCRLEPHFFSTHRQ